MGDKLAHRAGSTRCCCQESRLRDRRRSRRDRPHHGQHLRSPPRAGALTSEHRAGSSGVGIAGEHGVDAFRVVWVRRGPILGVEALECEELTGGLFLGARAGRE
jgi:hypothetical protein